MPVPAPAAAKKAVAPVEAQPAATKKATQAAAAPAKATPAEPAPAPAVAPVAAAAPAPRHDDFDLDPSMMSEIAELANSALVGSSKELKKKKKSIDALAKEVRWRRQRRARAYAPHGALYR